MRGDLLTPPRHPHDCMQTSTHSHIQDAQQNRLCRSIRAYDQHRAKLNAMNSARTTCEAVDMDRTHATQRYGAGSESHHHLVHRPLRSSRHYSDDALPKLCRCGGVCFISTCARSNIAATKLIRQNVHTHTHKIPLATRRSLMKFQPYECSRHIVLEDLFIVFSTIWARSCSYRREELFYFFS